MPQVLVPVIQAIGSVVVTGGITLATAQAIATGIMLIGSLALSSAQKRKAERQARAQYEASVVDRLVNVQTSTASRELVLGRTRKGGAVFFRSSVAPHNAVYVAVLALAGHEIEAVERVYFNETPVDLDGDGNVTTAPWGRKNKVTVRDTSAEQVRVLAHTPIEGTLFVSIATGIPLVNPGQQSLPYTLAGSTLTIESFDPTQFYTVTYQWEQFVSTARVYWHLGSSDQAADTRLQLLLPGTWTAAHRARGVAYLQCEFVYEETSFPTGLPNITAQIAGAKVYDPRYGVTHWVENPAILMRHVLTHPQFGKRTTITPAEDARIIAAANACEAPTDYGGGVIAPLYRAAIVVPFGAAARDVLDDLQQAMGGEWAYAAGEFFVRAGVYQAPVMHLTEADLAVVQRSNDGSVSQNSITLTPHRPRNDKINIVAARIWDQAARYIETPVPPLRADALIAADGAELVQEVVMPAVFFAPQAYHICAIMLRDSRDCLTVTLPFKMVAYPLELFDSITLTIPRYGWDAKEFRILGRTFSPDGLVHLTLKETTAAIFALGAPLVPGGLADDSGLPLPWDISPPTITSVTSGESELIIQSDGTIVNSVRIVWNSVLEASINSGGSIEVQWMLLPDGDWNSVSAPGSATEARIVGVGDLAVILIRARTRNSLAASDWGPQIVHQVIGKTEPPPDIEGLSIAGSVLSWTMPRRVPDLAGFVFRFHYGNNLDWNSATPLHTGLLTESPYDLVTRPGGVVTIMGKAQDTSGNQSLATANIVMNLGDPPIANVLEQWNFKALGWPFAPGEQSGWTLVAGDPSANALDSFYGTDNQSFYGADTSPFYEAGAYGEMVYVTPEVSINSALAGSIMTLAAQAQGTDLRIDYRLAGPGSFYGPNNDSFYRPDVAAFDPDLGVIVVTSPPFYGPAGAWQPWPGQLVAENDVYQFRVTIGAGTTRGVLQQLVLTIDAPDLEEEIANAVVPAAGLVIPYTKHFTSIKTIQVTLQANASGAVTTEVDKTNPLAPRVRAFNAAHVAVAGASVDITLKGY